MSKNKENTKNSSNKLKKKTEKAPVKKRKKIIISIVAVLLAAAIAASSFFLYNNTTIFHDIKTTIITKTKNSKDIKAKIENSSYEFVSFKGGYIPKSLKTMLETAENDRKASCEKYGTYYTIKDIELSKPEMEMYYIDEYTNQISEDAEEYELTDEIPSTFNYTIYPEEQYYEGEKLWSTEFIDEACETAKNNICLFYEAINNGFIPTDDQIAEIISSYADLSDSLAGAEEVIHESYGDELTYGMYAAARIYTYYSCDYQDLNAESIKTDVSIDDASEYIKGYEKYYQVYTGRIFPIYTDNDSYKDVTTEEEFLEYVNTVVSDETYDADTSTYTYLASYDTVSNAYGDDLADYVFSADRKAGEITTFEGETATFLVYTEKPAYFSNSVSCVVYYKLVESDDDEAECKKKYNDWVENGAKKEDLIKICNEQDTTDYSCEIGEIEDYRVNEFLSMADSWLNDSSREQGDYTTFIYQECFVILYFDHSNPDDYDYLAYTKESVAYEKFYNLINETVLQKTKTKRADGLLNTIPENVHTQIDRTISKINNSQSY